MKTTLNKIKAHYPCVDGWKNLLKSLGKTEADDEPLSIRYIIESNGIANALWCLRAVEGHDREIRLLTIWLVRNHFQHLTKEDKCINAVDVAEKYADGLATSEELQRAQHEVLETIGIEDRCLKGFISPKELSRVLDKTLDSVLEMLRKYDIKGHTLTNAGRWIACYTAGPEEPGKNILFVFQYLACIASLSIESLMSTDELREVMKQKLIEICNEIEEKQKLHVIIQRNPDI